MDITYRLLKNKNSESQYLARLIYDDEYRKKKVAELVVYFTKKGREMKKMEKKNVEKATGNRNGDVRTSSDRTTDGEDDTTGACGDIEETVMETCCEQGDAE